MSDNLRSKFLDVYQILKSELMNDPAFDGIDISRKWVDHAFNDFYLVFLMQEQDNPGEKLSRGISVLDSYKLLKDGKELTDDEIFLASALGWCIEWLHSYFLFLGEILEKRHTIRDRPLWFKDPKIRMMGTNGGIILRHQIQRVLKKHFRNKKYYVELLDLFNEVEFQTAYGQLNDLLTTLEEEKDLSKYSLDLHCRIVQYKTASYSFYPSVACALLMSEENLEDHLDAKSILIDIGNYFQIQVDYLNCFGDPENGKTGTDIEEFKCSWLVVKALELCNDEQKKVLHENYGKQDPACVARVKELYNELNLQGAFVEYEIQSYVRLTTSIDAYPSAAVQAILKSFLAKVYKRA
ncbi:farnesyl pyrophosphate synthase 1-like [Chenopodium quinoa]|uniref:farnesyl pyrophosphate synthase 1-like n=1 Tax=Chenopodium quinoa TaxID=63459 RepID=UPI000B77BE27|nr:farnesyl pyrophosphate synthase 1-like [Chenopodium quinoa]